MLFKGSMTALVTPFRGGRVDEVALEKLIDWQISSGTDVLVPCGTTGEAATIEPAEHERIIRICIARKAGKVKVLAGAGSNSTSCAIQLAKKARAAGADGMLQVTPYYNKPTQEGLYRHFEAIAKAVDLPMVLYNVPGRTAVNMLPETTLRLAKIGTIMGIKEASGKLDQIKRIINEAPPDFAVFSGEDAMNFEIYSAGGKGCISVTSNVAPDRVAAVWNCFSEGKTDEAKTLHNKLSALNAAMFLETNPIPAKTALALMGRISEEFRLPLTPMGAKAREELVAALKTYNLI